MKDDMAFAERLPVDMKEGNGDVAIVMGTKVVVGAVGTFIIFGGGVDAKSRPAPTSNYRSHWALGLYCIGQTFIDRCRAKSPKTTTCNPMSFYLTGIRPTGRLPS